MLSSIRRGFLSLLLNWGLLLVVLATNLGLALVVAAPVALQLRQDLAHTGASSSMMYAFDYDWWKPWSERQPGVASEVGPGLLGPGFAFKSLQALLDGRLPADLFPDASRGERAESYPGDERAAVHPVILGVGVVFLLVQVFLLGGLLGVFRSPSGGWTVRGLAHGSGFYFGRMFRTSLIALAAAWVVFALNRPFARWVDEAARSVVSERTALLLLFGRHALLLLVLVLVHMVVSYARVILVEEDRRSALLATLTSLGFCLRNLLAAAGQYVVVVGAGLVLFAIWTAFDVRFVVTGWKTQLVALAGFELFILLRIGLRLGLLASQLELYRARSRRSPEPEEAKTDAVPEAA